MTPAIQAGGHHRVLVSGAEGEPCRTKARPREDLEVLWTEWFPLPVCVLMPQTPM